MPELYPLLFTPVLKDYIWGGRNLASRLGRPLPAGPIAESWEIAAHPDGDTAVAHGSWQGRRLTELVAELGLALIGRRSGWALDRGKFPLLIKLLDAQQRLSVQVHPDDEYARVHEGDELGKTEMWVVLHAEPDAAVILGLRPGTTPADLRRALSGGDLRPCLNHIPVTAGDHFCVPAGTIHAIMGGCLIAEVQQNSNTTYRVFDWNRVGADGKPRPLHVAQALAVTDFGPAQAGRQAPVVLPGRPGIRRQGLCQNRYFRVERLAFDPGASWSGTCDGETFEIWGILAGQVSLRSVGPALSLASVRFVLLPAAMGDFALMASAEGATVLRIYVDE